MPAISPAALVARLRAAADPAADRDLLRAFLADRSEPAFAALVRRHGPMVLGVCRRVLGNPHDADDAFQATFLVLARKANTVGRPDRLPGWLHTIAVRTATEVRRMRDRRRKLEVASPERLASLERQRPEFVQSELAALLDEELARLPEHYRVPVVLCELQGMPRKEAAARLGLPEGTLSSRLAKARKLLADRLAHRGVTASTAAIAAALGGEAAATVSAGLAVGAARAALTSAASAVAAHAADGVVKALLVTKLKGLALAVGLMAACAGGVATLPVGLSAPVPAEPKPEALVRQLGSDSFADRDAAEKKLRAMGARALPAVTAGITDADAEVARRCRSIAVALRADARDQFAREFRPDGTGTYAHPVWARYRAIAGDSSAARKLFAEIIADPRRFKRLDEAEADPTAAGEVYKSEVARAAVVRRANEGPDAPPLPDLAACLLLGSFEATAKAVPDRPPGLRIAAERLALLGPRLWGKDALNGPNREPLARLYAAWCDRRALPDVLQFGLDRAVNWRIKETLPTARRIAKDGDAGMTLRLSALTGLAYFGTEADDAPAAEALMDDTAVIHTATYDGVRYVAQVRDVATAVRVKLAGRDPESLGFRTLTGTAFDWTQTPIPAANNFPRGFPTDAARDAAHDRATAFLATRLKPDAQPDQEAEKLVKQLGSANFADRTAAERKLKALGSRARAAVLAGAKDPDPEIAQRCTAILRHVREAERQAFLAGKLEAGPAWKRFKELVGDTKASRELYAEMMADDRRAGLIEKAEVTPAKAAEVYAAEVTRAADASLKAFQQFIGQPAPANFDANNPMRVASQKVTPLGDVVAILFLGARPLPNGAKDPSASWAFRASFADAAAGPNKEPFRKLFAAWLDRRTDPETVRAGLETALFAGVPDALPTARRLAADPKAPAPAKGLALATVGNHGTKDDLPLLTACRTDARVSSSYKTVRNEVHDTQVRDVAAAMALHLSGQDFEKFGFEGAQWQVWWLPANPAPYKGITQFKTDAARDAALKKAWEWLDKQPKPDPEAEKLVKQLGSPAFADRDTAERKLKELGPRAKPVVRAAIKDADPEVARRCQAVLDHILREQAWPRFAKLLGDDQHSRALFDAVWSVPRNVELIEAAGERPEGVAKLYSDRQHELNEQCRNPGQESWHPGKVSVGEVAGWMYLGTFPGAEKGGGDRNVFLLDFPDMWRYSGNPYPFPAALGEGPLKVGARRILVKWTETRIGRSDFYKGLNGAMAHGVAEMVPVAKRYLTEVKEIDDNHRKCLVTIGKCGTKDDLPFLARYADDRRVAARVHVRHPGDDANPPREFRPGKDQSSQMRDVAVAMMLVLNGATRERLDEFGFLVSRYWPRYTGEAGPPAPLPPVGKRPHAGDDPFTPSDIGFIHDADRDAAHQKAKAWLAQKRRPE